MGNDMTSLVEYLEPEGDDVEIDEETGLEVKSKGEAETDESDKSTEKVEDKSETDDEKKEDEEPTDEDQEEEGAEEEETPDPLLSIEEQNKELRQILRQQKKDMVIMQSKLDRLGKKAAAKTDEEELFGEDEPKDTGEELSEIETIQSQLTELAQVKAPVLDTLVEIMELNSNYSDVRQVCSQSNFADMFAAVGDAMAEKEGADPTLAAMQAELSVWKMPNPYKYMYDLIKKYHPSYIKKATKEKKVEKKLPDKTPTSLANVPGKTEGDNKWTAARIDEMPETDLDQVPDEVYEKYLAGDLD